MFVGSFYFAYQAITLLQISDLAEHELVQMVICKVRNAWPA